MSTTAESVTARNIPPRGTVSSRNDPPILTCDKCGGPIGDSVYRCPRPHRARCESCGLAWIFGTGRHPTYCCSGCERTIVCYSREPWPDHYCSDECRRAAVNARARDHRAANRDLLDCTVCGERIDTRRRDARYCSGACRQKAYRTRAVA